MKEHKNILAYRQLKPSGGFSWRNPDDYSTLKCYTGDPPTEGEILEQAKTSESVEAMNLLRLDRNLLLSETDWWGTSDNTMSSEQSAYRKELRDFPSSATPSLDSEGRLTDVTWPIKL